MNGPNVPFERERCQFCEKMYELERSRGDLIERRVQFYLTLLTLLLGAASLKIEMWNKSRSYFWSLWHGHPALAALLFGEAILGAGAAATSFLCIACVFKPRLRGEKPYPPSLVYRLFRPEPGSGDESEATLLRDNARRYALAVEAYNRANTQRSKWLVRVSAATVATLIFFGLFVATALAIYLF